ncbi:DgyrCDS3913 [Dimorphilus gyrociliatus]|uniref:Negative elongation factor E n=1 Tax=Dimorphilus gyrociliatus TaxID=2664684 RepID=A0A7I8VJY6_9ANNE|nr:DgyrCDS3913 [Dimorphilus gyrociliatus]
MKSFHLPTQLTDAEKILQKKFADLKKVRKQFQSYAKPSKATDGSDKKNAEEEKKISEKAADATEQAKKLLKSGGLKIEVDKKEGKFKKKRVRRDSNEKQAPVGFQPFQKNQSPERPVEEEEKKGPVAKKKYKPLLESFVSGGKQGPSEKPPTERHTKREFTPKRGNTVYVSGHGITEEILRKACSEIGSIININVEPDKHCGFVTFESMEDADTAVNEVSGSIVCGVQLNVSIARRQPNFETPAEGAATQTWSSIAAIQSQKSISNHKETRDMVKYDDIF